MSSHDAPREAEPILDPPEDGTDAPFGDPDTTEIMPPEPMLE